MSNYNQPQQTVGTQLNAETIIVGIDLNETKTISLRRPKELDCPSLPATFLRRKNYFDGISNAITNDELAFCVVTGPSGSGKTSAVVDLYANLTTSGKFVGTWVDCRQVVLSEATISFKNDPNTRNLIVLDFLNDDNHALITSGFIERYQSIARIVVITTSEAVVRRVLQMKGMADRRSEVVVELQNFTSGEIAVLLKRASGIELSDHDVSAVAAHTLGYPQFCQMINDILVSEECTCSEILRDNVKTGSSENLAQIISYWLSSRLMSAPAEAIFKCLLHIPFIGLDLASVSLIVGEPEEQVANHMNRLVAVGLVSSAKVLFEGAREIYYIHDVVRSLREHLHADESLILDWRAKYMRQLETQLSNGPATNADVLRCLDAWISGWASVFLNSERAASNPNAFLERLEIHQQLLPRILPAISSCFKQADQLAFVLRPYIHQKMHCSPLTGLGHLLRDVEPNYLVADIMWNGVFNYDAWGRASALGVCVSHWVRLGESAHRLAFGRLQRWFGTAYTNVETRQPDWTANEGYLAPGIDVLVALAGLARTGGQEAAVVQFNTARYQANFGDCYAVNAMMLLRAWQNGLMRQSAWRAGWIRQLLGQSLKTVCETYLGVFDFLKEQQIESGLRDLFATVVARVPRTPDEVSLSLDIGRYADCDAFVNFARLREPNARFHF